MFRFLILCVWLFGGSVAYGAEAHASEEEEVRARFFMPALEVGPVWSSDPKLKLGLLFRTSLEYRFRRVRAPFLRASYDVTTAGFRTESKGGHTLDANASFHDLLLGGGLRGGPNRLQWVGALQGGVQIREVPQLEVAGSRVSVASKATFAPIVTGAVGAEWYVFPGVAATAEVSARVPFSPDPSLMVAGTVGVTTSL